MQTIKTVYKTGQGPSSSHTVGPFRAAKWFKDQFPQADAFEVTLFGSLAFTGEGHGTGKAIRRVLPEARILTDKSNRDLPHPNTLLFKAFREGELLGEETIISIGGGSIRLPGREAEEDKEIYPQKNFGDIRYYCLQEGISLLDYIKQIEGPSLTPYLATVWASMRESIERSLETEGVLPGGLNIVRRANDLLQTRCHDESPDVTMNRTISAYAFAVCEENAAEGIVVTAPTCGACGVLPSVLYYMQVDRGFSEEEILDALAIAALVGNVIRTNASISGAECGCQAEIGSACSMAAAALACLYRLDDNQIEYAAEIAMEHSLGLTCDPVGGLVQIPCIERNAVAAMRAVTSVNLSRFLTGSRKISFDEVVETMYRTGKDLSEKYRETSHGGLAAIYQSPPVF